jgi:hypothetical protein
VACLYFDTDEFLNEDEDGFPEFPDFTVTPDIDVTLDYTSPADPTDPFAVDVSFGAGIINSSGTDLDDLSEVVYSVSAITADGLEVGYGSSEAVALDEIPPVADGEPLPALPSASVELELSAFAAGRTVYLQPSVLVLNGGTFESEEPPVGGTLGICAPVADEETLEPVLDFPVTFTGEALPVPEPGDQRVTLPSDAPVEPGDIVELELSGFLPDEIIEVVECPVGEDCLEVPFELDPDFELIEEFTSLVDRATNGAIPVLEASAVRRAAAVDRAVGGSPDVAFADENGNATLELEIGDFADTTCGPTTSCEIVAQALFDTRYRATAALTYAADDVPTPAPTTDATPPGFLPDDQPGAPLPETGAPSPFIAAAGAALVMLGAVMVVLGGAQRQRRTRSA